MGFHDTNTLSRIHHFHKMEACCNATLDSVHLKSTMEEEMKEQNQERNENE
jgi:hypothetical protein